jgi:hypothetical protein
MAEAGMMLASMFGLRQAEGGYISMIDSWWTLLVLGSGLAIAFLAPNSWQLRFPRTKLAAAIVAALLFACLLRFAEPAPFVYFQF